MVKLSVGDISILDFNKADKLVEIGYEYSITEWQRLIGATDECCRVEC